MGQEIKTFINQPVLDAIYKEVVSTLNEVEIACEKARALGFDIECKIDGSVFFDTLADKILNQ